MATPHDIPATSLAAGFLPEDPRAAMIPFSHASAYPQHVPMSLAQQYVLAQQGWQGHPGAAMPPPPGTAPMPGMLVNGGPGMPPRMVYGMEPDAKRARTELMLGGVPHPGPPGGSAANFAALDAIRRTVRRLC